MADEKIVLQTEESQPEEALDKGSQQQRSLPPELDRLLARLKPRLVEYLGLLRGEDLSSPRHPNNLLSNAIPYKALRERTGLTREEVAEQIGISPEDLAFFEHGMLPPEDIAVPDFLRRLLMTLAVHKSLEEH